MDGKLEVRIDPNGHPGCGRFQPREMRVDVYYLFTLNNLTTEVDKLVEKTLELLVDLYAQGLNRLPSNSNPEEFEGVQALCTLLSSWAPRFRENRPVLFNACKHVLEFVRRMNSADRHFGYHSPAKVYVERTLTEHFF
jgi:hypothetical protein